MIYQGFIGGAYKGRSTTVDGQECVNWYPEANATTSKAVISLMPTPGTKLFCNMSSTLPIRGMYYTSTGRLFVVYSNALYEVFSTGAKISRGTLLTSSGQIYMADNGVQVCITDGSYGYIFTLASNLLVRITDSDYPNSTSHVVCVNGRFIVNKKTTSQYNIYWSNSYDGLVWDGLAVASAEFFADKLIAIQKTNNSVWMFGEQSSEVYYDSGDADQPFQRIQGSANNIGTAAQHSTAANGDNVFWIGSNNQGHGIVWMASGLQTQRISTHAIEYIIQSMARIDDSIGYCYQQEGHSFYVLNFPTANKTLCYDLTTGYWHERNYYDSATNSTSRHLGNCHCFAFGKNYIGSYIDGDIYELDLNTYTDNGGIIQRIRTAPHLNNEGKTVFYSSLELDVEKGTGITSPGYTIEKTGDAASQIVSLSLTNATPDATYYWELYREPDGGLYKFKMYADVLKSVLVSSGSTASSTGTFALGPTVTGSITINYTADDNADISANKIICEEKKPLMVMQYSNDGGKTWGNERNASIGKQGEYKASVKWYRLGSSKDRVFRIKYSEPAKCVLLNAWVEAVSQ